MCCKRETIKQQVLDVVDDWIENCNDDICYNAEKLLEPNAERNLRELYDRKIQLTKFRMSFAQGIQVGPQAYNVEILGEVINFLVDMETQFAKVVAGKEVVEN